jgi:hypothetical protein
MNTITERALLKRINRQLAWQRKKLHKKRHGGYFITGHRVIAFVASRHASLEELGRQLRALGAWEEVAQ